MAKKSASAHHRMRHRGYTEMKKMKKLRKSKSKKEMHTLRHLTAKIENRWPHHHGVKSIIDTIGTAASSKSIIGGNRLHTPPIRRKEEEPNRPTPQMKIIKCFRRNRSWRRKNGRKISIRPLPLEKIEKIEGHDLSTAIFIRKWQNRKKKPCWLKAKPR